MASKKTTKTPAADPTLRHIVSSNGNDEAKDVAKKSKVQYLTEQSEGSVETKKNEPITPPTVRTSQIFSDNSSESIIIINAPRAQSSVSQANTVLSSEGDSEFLELLSLPSSNQESRIDLESSVGTNREDNYDETNSDLENIDPGSSVSNDFLPLTETESSPSEDLLEPSSSHVLEAVHPLGLNPSRLESIPASGTDSRPSTAGHPLQIFPTGELECTLQPATLPEAPAQPQPVLAERPSQTALYTGSEDFLPFDDTEEVTPGPFGDCFTTANPTVIREALANANAPQAPIEAARTTQLNLEQNPPTTESLEFLRSRQQFQIEGRRSASQIRIPSLQIQDVLNGYTNMNLAHEIALNNDFRLEVYTPPASSLEEQVMTQMKKAYWDIFDEAISLNNPNPAHALGVFKEMKEARPSEKYDLPLPFIGGLFVKYCNAFNLVTQMLLSLLLPYNNKLRLKIETFLDETIIQHEINHKILEFPKYTDFIIHVLGTLCCPVRDRQIADLKLLTKPSDIFREIMKVMEQMQLDMANFLISEIRPTVIQNCVIYERKKFSAYMETRYRLGEDPLRSTRNWMLRHVADGRPHLDTIGRAFAETLSWSGDWPETVAMDYTRYEALSKETVRATYLGAAILSAFNSFRGIFEGGASQESGNHGGITCVPVQDQLKIDLGRLIQVDDCANQRSVHHAMDLLAEQSVKCCNEFMIKTKLRDLTAEEKSAIRSAVQDCSREDHTVRKILARRIQEYATAVIVAGKVETAPFPPGLTAVKDSILKVVVELSRLSQHNRAVFQNLYFGIIGGEVTVPTFIDQNNKSFCSSMRRALVYLDATPTDELAANETDTPTSQMISNAKGGDNSPKSTQGPAPGD